MVQFSWEQHRSWGGRSTGQMSPHPISSLYHTGAVSLNYTAHNASQKDELLSNTLPIMDSLVEEKWKEHKKKKEKSGKGGGVRHREQPGRELGKVEFDRKQMSRAAFWDKEIYIVLQTSDLSSIRTTQCRLSKNTAVTTRDESTAPIMKLLYWLWFSDLYVKEMTAPCVWFGLHFEAVVNKALESTPVCQDCPAKKLALKTLCSEVSILYRPSVAQWTRRL